MKIVPPIDALVSQLAKVTGELAQLNGDLILVDSTGHTVAAGKSLREMAVLKGTR